MTGGLKRNIIAGTVLFTAVFMIFILRFSNGVKNSKVILYPGPASLRDAGKNDRYPADESERNIALMHCTDTRLTVNNKDCYVYDTNVNHSRSWSSTYLPKLSRTPVACFDFAGTVKIRITVSERSIQHVTVRPLAYKIRPEIEADHHHVTFVIKKPDTYTVEFNNTPERALHIFANPIEKEIPPENNENIIYIGPGEWNKGTIHLKSGQSLYVAGGAVLHGTVKAEGVQNVKISGRGIIDGSLYSGWKGQTPYVPLEFNVCRNVTINGVLVLNANAWVCQGYEDDNMVIDGIKIISCRPNGDGITLQSCRNVEVKNCFVRSWDDSLVVKNYYRNSYDISFSHIQLWTDFAQSMEIGYETNKGKEKNSSIRKIRFCDITVLHSFHKPVLSIHNADDAAVRDITYRNITVEDCQTGSGDGKIMPYLIDFSIVRNSSWSSTKKRGTIQNVTVDGLRILFGRAAPSRIQGFDEAHTVSDVRISNLLILGKRCKNATDGKIAVDKKTTGTIHIQ
jgi:hypothetical protein